MICNNNDLADILSVCEIKDSIWVMRFQSPLVYILDVLSPVSEEIMEISSYSDIWGVYSDNLICQVNSYIHTRCSLSLQ